MTCGVAQGTPKIDGSTFVRPNRSKFMPVLNGAAVVLLFVVVPWSTVLASLSAIHFGVAGH